MQKTLRKIIKCSGYGLHSGRKASLILHPAAENTGVYFLRSDVSQHERLIAARWINIVNSDLSTTISNEYGVKVGCVEHVLAALRGNDIDNVIIEINGPEVPVLDGSALPWVKLIKQSGVLRQNVTRLFIRIQQPIRVSDGDKYAILSPAENSSISIEIDFPETLIGKQSFSTIINKNSFSQQLAPARTFGFLEKTDQLRERGLIKGGSLDNAIVLYYDRIINKEGLRFEDEFVRHKALDCLGDLALAGAPILGHLHAYKPGHHLNRVLLTQLFCNREAWSYAIEPNAKNSWNQRSYTKSKVVSITDRPARIHQGHLEKTAKDAGNAAS